MRRILYSGFLCTVLLWPLCGHTQDELVPDKHFGLYNGLPSKTLYSVCKDPQGFMWIGSENGVFRFDGKDFYHYDTRNGLCDNEILIIFSDSRGRVWCGGFNGKISVIQNGVVNTEAAFIRGWNSRGIVRCFMEDSFGNVYASTEKSEVFRIDPGGEVYHLPMNEMDYNPVIRNMWVYAGKLYMTNNLNVFEYHPLRMKLGRIGKRITDSSMGVRLSEDYPAVWQLNTPPYHHTNLYTGREIYLDIQDKDYVLFLSQIDADRVVLSLKTGGTLVYDMRTSRYRKIVLPEGAETQDVLWFPEEKRLWLMTGNAGLYSVDLAMDGRNKPLWQYPGNVSDVCLFDGQIYVSKDGENWLFHGSDSSALSSLDTLVSTGRHKVTQRLGKFCVIDDTLYHWGNLGLYSLKNGQLRYFGYHATIKDFTRLPAPAGHSYFRVHSGIYRVQEDTLQHLVRDRVYAMTAQEKYGLWLYLREGLRYYDTRTDSLYPVSFRVPDHGRVVEMKVVAPGVLLLCTGNRGLIFLKDGKRVLKTVDAERGLWDNDCRQVEFSARGWVVRHTLGLSLVEHSGNVQTVSEWNGVPLAIVNRIFVHGDSIFLTCNRGLLHLGIEALFRQLPEKRNVAFLRVLSGNRLLPADTVLLEPGRNRLKIDYALPEYNHPEWVVYYWRINGEQWNTTTNKSLEFADLRPGEYRLEVKGKVPGYTATAVSSFYVRVKQPFWMSPYWIALAVVLLVVSGWGVQQYWYRRKWERANIQHQLMSFEQKALNAMMNPHFVFNAMGSIQYLLNHGDNKRANDYLVKFSRLIRKSLETSQLEFCYLDDEIERLTLYLQLEKMRLGGDMDLFIEVDERLNPEYLKVPTLILQTYAENAIIHGMRPGRKLTVSIGFLHAGNHMEVYVRDNGPGFNTEKANTSRRFGFKATEKRLALLSKITGKPYRMRVISPVSPEGGTEVRLEFPLHPA